MAKVTKPQWSKTFFQRINTHSVSVLGKQPLIRSQCAYKLVKGSPFTGDNRLKLRPMESHGQKSWKVALYVARSVSRVLFNSPSPHQVNISRITFISGWYWMRIYYHPQSLPPPTAVYLFMQRREPIKQWKFFVSNKWYSHICAYKLCFIYIYDR